MAPIDANQLCILDDRLALRWASADDAPALGRFDTSIYHGAPGDPSAMTDLAADLLDSARPGARAHATVVVKRDSGEIVSSVTLIPQRWQYAGVPLTVAQIEAVATAPDWRGQGLVKHQLEVLHKVADKVGAAALVIAGIPGYYRQFGYDHALLQGEGRRVDVPDLPLPAAAGEPPYRLRAARPGDAALLARLGRQANERLLVTCPRDEAMWRYEVAGHRPSSLSRFRIDVIESLGREPIGAVAGTQRQVGGRSGYFMFEIEPPAVWLEVVPSVVSTLADRDGPKAPTLLLGREHPAYEAIPAATTRSASGIAWYVRVPDVACLLSQIRSALSANLRGTAAAGISAHLRLDLGRQAIDMMIQSGEVTGCQSAAMAGGVAADAYIPTASFIKLVFGYRTLHELERESPDCRCASERAQVILTSMFPGRPSHAWEYL